MSKKRKPQITTPHCSKLFARHFCFDLAKDTIVPAYKKIHLALLRARQDRLVTATRTLRYNVVLDTCADKLITCKRPKQTT